MVLIFPIWHNIVLYVICLTKCYFQPKKRPPSNEFPTTSDTRVEEASSETSQLDLASDKNRATLSIDNNEISPVSSITLISNEEQQQIVDGASSVVGDSSGTISNNEVRHAADHEEVSGTVIETIPQTSDTDLVNETSSDGRQGIPSSPVAASIDTVVEDHPIDSGQNVIDTETSTKIDQEESQPVSGDAPIDVISPLKDADVKVEPHLDQKNHQENQAVVSPVKMQDQLDEVKYVNNKEKLSCSDFLLLAFKLLLDA